MTDLDKLRADAETARQYAQHHGVKIWTEHIFAALALADAALARIAKVEALHSPRTIQVVTGDCALGECEHDDECPTEAFEQCVACDALADRVSIYYEEENASVAAYPCGTVRALTEGENE